MFLNCGSFTLPGTGYSGSVRLCNSSCIFVSSAVLPYFRPFFQPYFPLVLKILHYVMVPFSFTYSPHILLCFSPVSVCFHTWFMQLNSGFLHFVLFPIFCSIVLQSSLDSLTRSSLTSAMSICSIVSCLRCAHQVFSLFLYNFLLISFKYLLGETILTVSCCDIWMEDGYEQSPFMGLKTKINKFSIVFLHFIYFLVNRLQIGNEMNLSVISLCKIVVMQRAIVRLS